MAIDKNQKSQTRQVKRFQNLTISYRDLIGKMSVGDRMSMLGSSEGQSLLSSLTPYQLADMFPDYYKRQYPDVGKILKSISSPSFKPMSAEQAAASMDIDRRRLGAGERINYPKPEVVPKWLRKLQEETGVTLSDPGAKAKLSNEKKAILDELAKGKISADDPKVAFLKDLSEEDLLKAGIKKQTDPEGKILFSRTPTEASKLSDAEISDKIKAEAQTSFSPREQAVLDLISKREGSGHPDIIFGDKGGIPGSGKYSKDLGLDKRPLSDRSISEVLDLQKQLTQITRKDGWGGGKGTSAIGTGQMIRETLIANLRALGIPESEWPNIKFDKNLQQRLTLQNFKTMGIGDPNADPSTWNMQRLGKQYESLDVSKGFKGLSETERQKIAEASPIKPVPGSVTGEAIIAKRKELERQEIEQKNTIIAEKTIPKLPDGVDPKIVAEYNKESPARKQDILAMIEAAGRGDQAKGVATLNRIFKENPALVQETLFNNTGKLSFSDAAMNNLSRLSPHTQGALNKFQEFTPEGTRINSTYRPPEHELERSKPTGPGAHTRGSAIDVRTRDRTPEQVAQTIQALKRAGFTKILLEPGHIHAEANPGQNFHISNYNGGNEKIGLNDAYNASSSVAFNEELPGNQLDREKPKPPQIANVAPTATPAPAPAPTTTQVQTQEQTPILPSTANNASQTAGIEPKVMPVNVYAEGGQENIDSDQIKAMPIDSLKGDNSVVMDKDNKPLFTMNTKEEQAVYNPRTRQVDIQPLSKTDPDKLGENKKQNTEALDENIDMTAKENQIGQMSSPQAPDTDYMNRSTDTSVTITEEIFKDPSFRRAIAKTRFHDTGDATLGGHFGMANADLG